MSSPLSQVGRYHIIDKLGQGGMGSLYLARDPAIDRLVAIKLLRDDFDNQELRERFAREARAAGGLRHPNIVIIFDVGEHEGQPFIAMEYIPGETLGAVIKRGEPLEFTRTLSIVEEVCDGLNYAHGKGIVHRDIKPANIMIDSGGVVKILDFGIAHVAESGMTKSGSVVGTLNYMSPEQILGKSIDRRCDVFAVGAVLYELITLRQAFPGGLQDGILNKIVSEQPTPLTELHPGINPALERIVKKSLEKDPARRYADLAQMQRDLADVRTQIPETPRAGPDAMTMPLGARVAPEGPGGRRETDRELLAKRRAAEIDEQLRSAQAALEAGDYDQAIAAGERAAILDPDDSRALDLMARARTSKEEARLLQIVGEARAQIHEGDLTRAGELIEQARATGATIHPNSAAAVALESARLDLERARERAELVRKAIARATGALERQEFESAIRSANEALALDPALTEALNVRRRAQAEIEKQRRDREREARLAARAPASLDEASRSRKTEGADASTANRSGPPRVAPAPRTTDTSGRWRVAAAIAIVTALAAVVAFVLLGEPSAPPAQPATASAVRSTPAGTETQPAEGSAPTTSTSAPVSSPPPDAASAAPLAAARGEASTPGGGLTSASDSPAPAANRSANADARPVTNVPPATAPAAGPAIESPQTAAATPPTPQPAATQSSSPASSRTIGTPSAPAADEAAIRQTIQRYEQALASLDPTAVRTVYPTVNMRTLAAQMATYSSFRSQMQVGRLQIGPNGQTALATGLLTTAPVLKATGREVLQRRPTTILLRKRGDSWLIQEIRPAGLAGDADPARPGQAGARAGQAGARAGQAGARPGQAGVRPGPADGVQRPGRQ